MQSDSNSFPAAPARIIWINGAFGSGKTQTAFELHRRLPGSFVYDPERIGYFLRRNLPHEMLSGDFQDEPLWRVFNREIINRIRTVCDGVIIIPMTLYRKDYFDEIIGRLVTDGARIDHYILGATRETILKRLAGRLERKGSWPARQIDACLRGFEELRDRSRWIDTDGMDLYAVVEAIAAQSGLGLIAAREPRPLRALRRVVVQIRHWRL